MEEKSGLTPRLVLGKDTACSSQSIYLAM